jgi:hypothetical protein
MQQQGFLTVYLFAVIEACVHNRKSVLRVVNALPATQKIFEKYGFQVQDARVPLKVSLILGDDSKSLEPMRKALAILKNKHIIADGVSNLRILTEQLDTGWKFNEDGTSCLGMQTDEIQRLDLIRHTYFRHDTHVDEPERAFYLVPEAFPTAEQLADPVLLNQRFPKPKLDI